MERIKLLEKKSQLQEQYICSLETNNYARTSFLRGKLALLDELLRESE